MHLESLVAFHAYTIMSGKDITIQLTKAIDDLSSTDALQGIFHEHRDGDPLPSGQDLEDIIDLSRAIIFPGFYGRSSVNMRTIKYHIGVDVEKLHKMLSRQVLAGLCFGEDCHCEESAQKREDLIRKAEEIAAHVIGCFPRIRRQLYDDACAAYEGDPAADNMGEVISCYPVLKALTNYRIAHELVLMDVPLIPRLITELAHSETGIDIHPAATIGNHFTIDHGTGVVIGATCRIGNNVKLYQGVTLGAKSFPLDADGNPIKGIPRHPIIDDDVVIYANATLLGRIHIGKGCVVGANVWVTRDMKPYSKKYKTVKPDSFEQTFTDGGGI